MARTFQIGVMLRREHPPEDVAQYVRRAEKLGFDEIWLVEDCFYASGIAPAAVGLAGSERIRVGLGIMPAVARNPAFTAMEIATLARMYPGRFLPGIGHGVTEWMKQIGAFPASQLAALEETAVIVRALLRGEKVDFDGKHAQLNDVQLEFPPDALPPVSLGVRGPKSLRLSGRAADGTILSEPSAAAYIEWARGQIAAGQREAGREGESHRVTVYCHCLMSDDVAAARAQLRPVLAWTMVHGGIRAQLAPLGILDELDALIAAGGEEHLAREMPDEWVDQLVIVGTAEQCREAIIKRAEAGADSLVLVPMQEDAHTLERLAEALLV